MFERRLLRMLAAGAFVAGVLHAGPARAVGTLGFSISTNQGYPGDNVDCHVTPADIAAQCTTTVDDLGLEFEPVAELLVTDYDFLTIYFPACVDPSDPDCSVYRTDYTYEQEAYTALAYGSLGIYLNLDLGFGGAADLALPQTFVLTFADLATQVPVGQRSLFDMTTGEGSITVPNIAPGFWALAAACVEPNVDLVPDAITAGAAILQSLGVPLTFATSDDFVNGLLLDPSSGWFILDILPDMLVPMMVPKAQGVKVFTIPQCGNHVVELGEQCDDGNTVDGDCCSSTCQFEAGGSACPDDGNVCTSDVCNSTGSCTHPGVSAGTPCPDDADVCTDDVCDGAGTCSHPIICADVPVDGKYLKLRKTPSGTQQLKFISKDPDVPFPAPNGPNDPRTVGATLEILTEGEGMASFDLPAANWTANGTGTTFKFKNPDAPSGPSVVKVSAVSMAKGKLLKVQARGTGVPLVDPLVRAAARFRTGLARSCALFDPTTVKRDLPNYFLAKKAPAPAVPNCSNAALGFSPSGAFLDP